MNRILYLHGFASSPASSKARHFLRHLTAAGFQVDVPDLAQGDFEHLTLSRQLSVMEELAAGEPMALVGSSMGGYLAALYAARHPEVTRVVLLAPAFAFAHRWPDRLGAATASEWRRTGWLEVFHYALGRPSRVSYALLEDGRQYEEFPAVNQPALIFHGEHDDVVPVALSREFAASHPNAVLEVVDSGHDLLNVLDAITPKVIRFLQQSAPPG